MLGTSGDGQAYGRAQIPSDDHQVPGGAVVPQLLAEPPSIHAGGDGCPTRTGGRASQENKRVNCS